MDNFLAFFVYQCRGVQFYDFKDGEIRYGMEATLHIIESIHDPNCIMVFVKQGGSFMKLGHIAAEVAEYLHPLLSYYRITW